MANFSGDRPGTTGQKSPETRMNTRGSGEFESRRPDQFKLNQKASSSELAFCFLVPPSDFAPVHFHMLRIRSARSIRSVPKPPAWLCHSFSPGTRGCGQELSSKCFSNRRGMKRVRLA